VILFGMVKSVFVRYNVSALPHLNSYELIGIINQMHPNFGVGHNSTPNSFSIKKQLVQQKLNNCPSIYSTFHYLPLDSNRCSIANHPRQRHLKLWNFPKLHFLVMVFQWKILYILPSIFLKPV